MAMKTSSAVTVLVLVFLCLSSMLHETEAACAATTSLLACLPATQSDIMPSATCCTQLSSYVANNGQDCLCSASTSNTARSDLALKLPQKCNLKFKAGTTCNGNLTWKRASRLPRDVAPLSELFFLSCPTIYITRLYLRWNYWFRHQVAPSMVLEVFEWSWCPSVDLCRQSYSRRPVIVSVRENVARSRLGRKISAQNWLDPQFQGVIRVTWDVGVNRLADTGGNVY